MISIPIAFKNNRHLIATSLIVVTFFTTTISSAHSILTCKDFYEPTVQNTEEVYDDSSNFDYMDNTPKSSFFEITRNLANKAFRTFRKMKPVTPESVVNKFGGLDNTLKLLNELGYNSLISSNLISDRPDLAYQILLAKNLGMENLVRASTVYRVIRVQNESDFRSDYFSPKFSREIYVADNVQSGLFFAHGNRNSDVTIVLEIQVPNILLRNPRIGLSGRYISFNDASDILPFLNRKGLINWKNRNEFTYSILWKHQ